MNSKKTITAHMVVRNEDKWIWYAIMSVINYVDRMIIFDNGSIDRTVEIIEYIQSLPAYSDKILFESHPEIEEKDFWKLRQKQIDLTQTDYMMVLDGDEIYWDATMKEIVEIINNFSPEQIAVHFINCGGDIYHYRDDSRELYPTPEGGVGTWTCHIYSMRIEGLNCFGEYGVEGQKDKFGNSLGRENCVYATNSFLHTTVLQRSSSHREICERSRLRKLIYRSTYDYAFPPDFKYPEVFYLKQPDFVASPWKRNRNVVRLIMQFLHDIKFKINIKAGANFKGPLF